MEREGIYYAFEHENGAHTLVLYDDVAALPQNPAMPRYALRADTTGDARQAHGVKLWRAARRLRPGRVYLRDYNPATPGADLGAEGSAGQADPAWEIAAYPGGHVDAAGGRRRAKTMAEALQADAARIEASTDMREVRAGDRFTLEGHPVARENAEHYVVEAVHHATAPGYVTGQGLEERFDTQFIAARREVAFRPPRRTPWPRIAGVQTAMVTGDDGAEITPHEHVAVRVSFHWLPGEPSCRVRVGQLWVGAGFGAMAIPRIGDEVIVTFEEGDPDRPLIVGALYNGAAKPPYDPVETPDVFAVRSNSTPGGGGANELRFRDKAGEETILLHAQRDLDLHVKNDARESVLGERHASVAKDDLLKVEGDSHAETVGDSMAKVGGDRSLTVGGDAFAGVSGARHDDVGGEWRQTAGGDISVDAGGQMLIASGAGTVIQAGAAFHLKAGAAMVIEGTSQLSLKVGGSFVDIGPSGVSITGPMVKINSGGSAGSGAGTKPKAAKAPKAPKAPKAAATTEAGAAPPPPPARPRPMTPAELDSNPTAAALRAAHESGAPFCEQCEAARRAAAAQAA
jgi:type VI secretion system secreted protein VgrG